MKTTIRGIDKDVFRRAKVLAGIKGFTIGQVISDALKDWLAETDRSAKRSILDLKPKHFGREAEHLSEEIDMTSYGA